MFNALALICVWCTVVLLDGAELRQQLGFDDQQVDSDFSDEENIGGGK